MADGPDHEKLFYEMRCLNAQVNLKEIVSYLRFSKGDGMYQSYLKHYVPMLAKLEDKASFDEFIDEIEDKDRRKELSDIAYPPKPKAEPKVEKVEVKVEEPKAVEAPVVEALKKAGKTK